MCIAGQHDVTHTHRYALCNFRFFFKYNKYWWYNEIVKFRLAVRQRKSLTSPVPYYLDKSVLSLIHWVINLTICMFRAVQNDHCSVQNIECQHFGSALQHKEEIGLSNTARCLEISLSNTARCLEISLTNTARCLEIGLSNTASCLEIGLSNTSRCLQIGLSNTTRCLQIGLSNTARCLEIDLLHSNGSCFNISLVF
jgi:hypothetical protein